ncbi:hypothetical protein V7S43_006431 [Phytophthora oleae]|uniref:RanBP2-type domain-containing protein n=1 Tax=Phytophthora oleae TaxID=2107226 RepID=A0ABD3FN53_9STRA
MLTESASLTPPLDSGERRAEARRHRREAAAPYPSKREKAEEEDDDEFFQEIPVSHKQRGNGFFARLASYIPIVNKLVTEEDEEEVQPATETSTDSIEIQTTQEDLDDEEEASEETEEQEEDQEHVEKEAETPEPQPETKEETPEDEDMLDVVPPPVTRAAPSFVTQKEQLTTPPRHNNRRGSRNSRSPSVASESGERSPATMRQRKRGDKRVFLPGPSQQSKMLRISSSQRRRQSTSPSPYDSALAVVKQKKAITLEEFERLQKQLHDMVEATPQAQLAMTQAALANGLERPFTRGFPGPMSFPGYVPGSIANQNHGALVVQDERTEITTKNGVPYGKRPRNYANGPIVFSGSTLRGQLTREERLMRKPRPSRLLTGAKRDAATRNAYSAAVAEKILSTLNKVQTPLEREAQKPTPSTSMSWAKYHLSLVESDKKRLDDGMEIDSDDVAPPTNTVPRVAFPQPTHKPAVLSFGSAAKPALQTPAKNSNGVTSAFSPQAVSMTPAITKTSTPEQPTFEKIGEFKFTLPLRIEGAKQVDLDDEDTRVRFVFSPPPSMREPPVKTSRQTTTAGKTNAGAAPFDFMPSSPKTKSTEWVSKPPTAKGPEKPKAAAKKPAAPKEAEKPKTTAPVSGGVNPLARFMQLKPGQWKCPGCSVLNEASSAKCPCCETANPGGAVAPKAAASTEPKAAGTISTNSFSFGVPAADAKKDADKSTAASITAGGFSFGAPATDSKKEVEKPTGSIASGGFSFGVPAADTKKDTEKPAAGITSGGFSFTAPTPSPASKTPATGGFSFGAPAASDVTAAAAAPISFGFSAPAITTKDASAKPATETEKTATPSFSFGVPAASASASSSTSTATGTATASSGFSFGPPSVSTTETSGKGKRKAPAEEEPKSNSAPSFSFGTTTATEAPKPSGFSFGAASEPKQATESDRPKKRLAPSSVAADSKSETPNPAFSFGTASKPPQVPGKVAASMTPSISFGTPSSSTTTDKPSTTPAFSFGANTQTEKATETKPTSGFTFGSSSSTSTPAPKPSTGFGQPASESKPPAFSFGASSASSAPVTSAPATSAPAASSTGFTFGQSSKTPATNSAPAFGAAPATSSAPGFGFGTATPPPTGKSTPPTVQAPSAPASTPAFTFGSSSAQPAPASTFGSSSGSTFGQAPASTAFGSSSSSGFGSGSTGFGTSSTAAPATAFGNSASTAPAAPAFSFGSASQALTVSAPAPATNQPAFAFGGSSAQSGFGATPAPSSGFGSSAPSGFGAPAPGFRSSSPAPAFGNQAAPAAPAFGSSLPPPTTTFGAPAFGAPAASAFGSAPPSSGFRTPSPTPAFGAAPVASAFGAAPALAFGTPSPAFGAPAAGAFGAPPTDGGFNMGAAPQHAKGRRILKAKPRGRRTS